MAAKRRERAVEELYNAMEMITEPEITPVMKGSFRMQGPVNETDYDIQKNMASSQPAKGFGKRSNSQKVHIRAESGTCNVCSAPCSSCMHLNQALMGSKTDEFSDDTCRVNAASQYSINEGEALPSLKDRTCENLQHATSETSNILSVNSSHDSFSENAESKATVRSFDISDALEDVEMIPKISSGGTGAGDQLSSKLQCVSDKYENSKGAEGHDDNISCVSRANVANVAVSYNRNLDSKNLSRSSASACSFGAEGCEKAPFSQKLDSPEVPSSKEADTGSISPKVRSPYTHSRSGKSLIGGSSKVSMKIYPKSEEETDRHDPLDEGLKGSDSDKQDEKSNELVKLSEMQEPPLQAVSGDEGDDSDIVEHDVKVCDICGDAGREDLLAICCRCSDGAEHTYCMREMLQKVPEGDWLCEECKFTEETENQKQGSDAEGKRTNKVSSSTQSSGKRQGESIEASSAAKRQAIETSIGSPKSSSPSRIAALSRDSSFKSLDKGKIRPASFANHSSNDILETPRLAATGPRLQTPKGTLLKSSSFSTLNSKPKVKLVDEIPQKQKGVREHASLDMKEGPARMIGKSMSFKSANSGRSNTSESKVKMLSPKFSYGQDIKGLKQVKERNIFERKNLSKLDRSLASSTTASCTVSTPMVDQKLTSCGETLTPSASNNRELRAAQLDGKLSALSKSNSNLTRKGLEIPVTSVGASSTNGLCNSSVEQKLNQVSPKDEPSSSSSWTAERPSNFVNGILQDGLPRSMESTNQGEKTKESSVSRSRPAVTTGLKGVPCQKCKEIGHAAEHCPIGSLQASGIDASAAKNTREEMTKGNKLKAAIQAAMRMKPGLCERTSLDQQLLVSNKMKSATSVEGTHEGQENLQSCPSDPYQQTTINGVKHLTSHSTDAGFPLKVGDSDSVVPSGGKPALRDLPSHASAVTPIFMRMPAIPEHEYIWQGGFEVHRRGKLQDIYGGIQAHLSTFASPKVLEVVNKFPQKIPLNEVPRLSTWPMQFLDSGAKEDHIALYFFAKDLESYRKNYKGLLDSMVKNDLALKGSLDGVEILIFPSNQLPENCNRWNMLFFLWGVFRGRRAHCTNSPKNSRLPSLNAISLDKDSSTDVMSLSQNLSSSKHIDRELYACDSSCNVVLAFNAPDMTRIVVNGDHDSKACSLEQASLGLEAKSEQRDSGPDSKFLTRIASSSVQLYPEMRCTSPSLEELNVSECRLETELKSSHPAAKTNSGSSKGEKAQMHLDASVVTSFKVIPVGNKDVGFMGSIGEEKMLDRLNSEGDQVKLKRNLKEDDGYIDKEAPLERNLIMEGLSSWQSNHQKRPHLDLPNAAPQTSTGTSTKMPWNEVNSVFIDRESVSKKLRTDFSGMYGSSSSRERKSRISFSEGVASRIHDLGPISSTEEKRCDEVCDEKVIPEDLGTNERYFFPVASHHAKDFRLGDNSMRWKELSSENGDRFHDGVPNLELALGAETKTPNKGTLPFFGMVDKNNDQDKPPVKEEEDDVPASLSLSLSFPFPDQEQTVKPVSKTEQLLPEMHHVNTSLLLFGGFSDK